jgi:hypothetical protein
MLAMPGLGILLMVTVAPALLVSAFHARRRQAHGRPMSGLARVGWFVFWIIFLPVLLAVPLFIAILVLCRVGG